MSTSHSKEQRSERIDGQIDSMHEGQIDAIRAEARFLISATCRFWWAAVAGDCSFGCGRTTDVSAQGVFVTAASMVPLLGAPIMLEIDLPPGTEAHPTDVSHLLLAAEGVVVRHHAQSSGFAARIRHASFSKQKDGTFE